MCVCVCVCVCDRNEWLKCRLITPFWPICAKQGSPAARTGLFADNKQCLYWSNCSWLCGDGQLWHDSFVACQVPFLGCIWQGWGCLQSWTKFVGTPPLPFAMLTTVILFTAYSSLFLRNFARGAGISYKPEIWDFRIICQTVPTVLSKIVGTTQRGK